MPFVFDSDSSSNIEIKVDAEIPKFTENISNEPFVTVDVSIINLSELESGTNEFASSPPVRVRDDV